MLAHLPMSPRGLNFLVLTKTLLGKSLSFLFFVIYFDLYYIADIPGMGIYFFCYEWVLTKLTLEGERFVKYRCLFVCIQFK